LKVLQNGLKKVKINMTQITFNTLLVLLIDTILQRIFHICIEDAAFKNPNTFGIKNLTDIQILAMMLL
jgi:ribonuclease D